MSHGADRETDEYKILRQYIKRSSPSVFVTNIYHLQRKGEPERYKSILIFLFFLFLTNQFIG
jgi:hypothetical protein